MSLFITLEGIDGAGTTTQCRRLAAWLTAQGHRVLETREPSPGPVGRMLRTVLQRADDAPDPKTLPWLFAADRADHLATEIQPALADGTFVICDRYVPSSLAYQSIDHPFELIWSLNEAFLPPHLTLFLDVPADIGFRRITARGAVRERFEQQDTLHRVAHHYRCALQALQERGDVIATFDGTLPIDDVHHALTCPVAEDL